jgi:hypothetical protein
LININVAETCRSADGSKRSRNIRVELNLQSIDATEPVGRVAVAPQYFALPMEPRPMSHIPNSAIPHAVAPTEDRSSERSRLEQLAELAKEHPRITAAAGVALAAGAAAAAVAAIRARNDD